MNSFKSGKRITSKKYFDTKSKMMCEHAWEWAKKEGALNVGEGDALWRTALAYITWKEPLMKEGILECYRYIPAGHHFKKPFYQAMRHTGRYGEDDVSRDQVLMSLAALHVNNNLHELDELSKNLPYKLSRKFNMTPDMFAWIRTFQFKTNKKFWTNIFCLAQIAEKSIALTLNKIIAKINGYKRNSIKNNDYTSRVHYNIKQKHNWFQKQLAMAYYSGYAFHLTCWQYYTLPAGYNPITKKILRKILLNYCEKENYLLRILLGDKTVTAEEIDGYEPREGFRWQAYLDGSWPNYNGEMSQEWKDKYLKYNQLDKDCLIRMWKKEMFHE